MLVLLPPSEGKATGSDGPPIDLTSLSYASLTKTRRYLLRELVRLAKKEPAALQSALGLSDRQHGELAKDATLLRAPTLPTMELYTGIVYDNLDFASLRGTAKRRAQESLVVASALFGLLSASDRVPSYRLSAGTTLPGLGGLAALWRPVLEPVLAAQYELVVDLRSGGYANLARVPGAVEVRVLRDEGGSRSVVSHDNKWTKGLLARALCQEAVRTVDDVAQIGRTISDDVEVEGRRVDLLLHGLASARPS